MTNLLAYCVTKSYINNFLRSSEKKYTFKNTSMVCPYCTHVEIW